MKHPPYSPRRGRSQTVIGCALAFLPCILLGQTAPSSDVIQLDPFEISADTDAGYRPTQTNVLTRTNRELIDLPQSVDVVPAEFLEDTGARMMDEAFVYVANAQVRNSSAGTGPNSILIRGFTNGSSFTDGIDTGSYRRDMFGYERMEVVKGPASAVQGRGTDSGYINFVLKKPFVGRDFTNTSVQLSSGEHDKNGMRATIDHNFAVNADKGIYGRVAASWDNHDHYFDFAEFKTSALYPSLRWVVNEKTDIAVVGEFMDIEAPARAPGHGFAWIPAVYRKEIPVIGDASDPITALNLPSNFNIGGPQRGTDDTVMSLLGIVTHKFTDQIQFRQAISHFEDSKDGEWWDAESNFPTPHTSISDEFKNDPATQYDPNGVYIPVQQGYVHGSSNRLTLQGDLNVEYGSENLNFVTLVGYSYKDRTTYRKDTPGTIPVRYSFIDLKNPENAWVGRSIEPGSVRVSRATDDYYDEFGYYIQQDANLLNNRLLLSGGYRRDTGEGYQRNYLTNTDSAKTKSTVNSWRAAGTFKVNDHFSVYGIVSTQNNPTATTNVWSDLPAGDPRLQERISGTPSTELTEFGFKGYLFENRVTYTASYYDITTTGKFGNDRVDTTSQAPDTLGDPVLSALKKFVTDGDVGSGIELALFGKITEQWDLNVAFGTLKTSQPITGGTRPIRHSPEWNGSVFTRYDFTNANGKGFGVRGGISMIGPFMQQVGGALSRIEMDSSQWRMDLGVDYTINRNNSIDLLVKNVTNEPYIVTRTNPLRDIRLTYKYSF
ncbi:TonB-dependent siderophore receptor [Synoicihabitans lomoniglobus]|uniref:TonB-dependent receptor n=1 Tax=Synoicihabitans lomoniglobus TaxID=2909285 RepID=A0AAE9ZQS7_9BACT|nr:TonB-dependent receptor [Opitutaceae bacterium LMO-M01]WED63405.1 TonB-dependent receptor [Opitutaceae bacterium LMO-M01]